jgi:hypothetical protein
MQYRYTVLNAESHVTQERARRNGALINGEKWNPKNHIPQPFEKENTRRAVTTSIVLPFSGAKDPELLSGWRSIDISQPFITTLPIFHVSRIPCRCGVHQWLSH